MSSLPRITERICEQVAREFDDLGPDACMAVVTQDLRRNNPALLDMACGWANDVREPIRMLLGFGRFYRLLMAQTPSSETAGLSALPCVSAETARQVAEQLHRQGSEAFTAQSLARMERDNPALLRMAKACIAENDDHLQVMQGFAFFYRTLEEQSAADRRRLN